MPQCITIDNREYLLVITFPNGDRRRTNGGRPTRSRQDTKTEWLVTPTNAPTAPVATICRHENGEFYVETMECFVHGFETAVQAQAHIDRMNIPDATVAPHHDGSFRVNIGTSQIHGFKSEMAALQRLHEIVTPHKG